MSLNLEVWGQGVGPTEDLSLRVSVATLVRVLFQNPEDGETMLALEHKATVFSSGGKAHVVVKAQPFGGAVRILNLTSLLERIGIFHFDSERSRAEQDFRIIIHPTNWETVKAFCLDHLKRVSSLDLEVDPSRELAEEFAGTLGVNLRPEQYVLRPIKIVLGNMPVLSGNVHASRIPTVRIYRVFEAEIVDHRLCQIMVANSNNHPSALMRNLALEDARKGGRGWANAMFVLPEIQIRAAYNVLSEGMRGKPLPYEDTHLENNVGLLLEGIAIPIYRKVFP